jgi:hypothetical protein
MLAGAPGSLIMDWREGANHAIDGDWDKAFIKMIPNKFVSDTAKAVAGRFDPTVRNPLSSYDAVQQAIGFRTGNAAERKRVEDDKFITSKQLTNDAKELRKEYLGARTAGARLKAQVRIVEFNKRADTYNKGLPKSQKPMMKIGIPGLEKIRKDKDAAREAVLN